MLVRADDRYISVAVETGKELGESGDNGTPDTAVPESYVYVGRVVKMISRGRCQARVRPRVTDTNG